jgi:hypothetical protein
MDVPFIGSGALSRAHYALVHKVEAAASPQLADQYLFAEVQSLRTRLAKPGLSIVRRLQVLVSAEIHVSLSERMQGDSDYIAVLLDGDHLWLRLQRTVRLCHPSSGKSRGSRHFRPRQANRWVCY